MLMQKEKGNISPDVLKELEALVDVKSVDVMIGDEYYEMHPLSAIKVSRMVDMLDELSLKLRIKKKNTLMEVVEQFPDLIKEWKSEVDYKINTRVFYNNIIYISVINNNCGNVPDDANDKKWTISMGNSLYCY